MKIKPKVSKIGLLLLAALFVLISGVVSLQTIYYGVNNPVAIQAYFALVVCIFAITNYLLLQKINYWLPILVISSLLLGNIPYEIMLPNGISLITSSEPQLSGLAEKIISPIGILFDLLFYPALHFVLLLLSKKVLHCYFQIKSI